MISLRKLRSLPPKTRIRKIITMLEELESQLKHGEVPDSYYIREVLQLLEGDDKVLSAELRGEVGRLIQLPVELSEAFLHSLHNVRYGIMAALGIVPADWDFFDPESGLLSRSSDAVLPISLYLDDVRSPYNVGSIFRTAEAFGVRQLYLSAFTADPEHKRALRTSMGASSVVPWRRESLEAVAESQPVFALELGGTDIEEFPFPSEGVAVLGSEELGISPEARRIAEQSAGIVSIPLRGAKGSLNVAAACGILLQAWQRNF
ncbi:MAG: TrmH family RNA methyltransferase [Spirochaetia bacterium]